MRWPLLLMAALLAGTGCGHAKTTDNAGAAGEPAHASLDHDSRGSGSQTGARSSPGRGHAAGVPVSTSPAGLLKPGAEEQIRDKLDAAGFGSRGSSSMSEGLRRFQDKNNLPATGVPDHETVRKLGLDPKQVFRTADGEGVEK